MNLKLDVLFATLTDLFVRIGLKLLGAIVLFLVGRWLISLALRLVGRAFTTRHLDETLSRYAQSALAVLLNVALVVALLGFFGVETTTFAALLAAAGVAIGMAWSGLLANFAAGAFLVVLRPFRVGDLVTTAGITGTVEEMGLFATTLLTADNTRTFVGNGKIFSDVIQNHSATAYRRVDRLAQLNHEVDPQHAVRVLRERIAKIPNVLATPAPDVEIADFNLAGPVLAVRPYCSNAHYWQVFFDTNRAISEEFGKAGFPAPETHHVHRTRA